MPCARRLLLALLAASALFAVVAQSAGAVVIRLPGGEFYGDFLRPGVNPAAVRLAMGALPVSGRGRSFKADGSVDYNGGPVVYSSAPYLIFWDPASAIPANAETVMKQYLTDVAAAGGGANNVFGVLRQYTDSAGFADYKQTFSNAQAIVDTQAYPANGCTHTGGSYPKCLSDAQLQAEVTRLITADSLPTDGPTSETEFPANAPIYFVITPANVNVCQSGGTSCADNAFCAYHSSYVDAGNNVLYSAVPFFPFNSASNPTKGCQTDGLPEYQSPALGPNNQGDNILDDMSHELSEALTDPLGTAWWNSSSGGNEIGDNCATQGPNNPTGGTSMNAYLPTLGGTEAAGTLYDQLINGDQYYTQTEWSNGTVGCQATATAGAGLPQPAFSFAPVAGVGTKVDPSASAAANGFSSTTWNWGDGGSSFNLGAPTATTHTYAHTGTYSITLTTVDTYGNRASSTHQVVVVADGQQPTASFTPPGTAPPGTALAFDGSASADHNGLALSYSWSFGDGSSATGATASHTYSAAGSYTVALTVSDGTGAQATTSHVVTVGSAPTAAATVTTAHPYAGGAVAFDGSKSSAATGATLSAYSWSFGDGGSGTGATASHTYAKPGTYTATLTVTDSFGLTGAISVPVTVVAPGAVSSVTALRQGKQHELAVAVSAGGTVKVGTQSATLAAAGKATFKLSLTKKQLGRLRHHKPVSITVTILYTPSIGPAVTSTQTVTLNR